MVDIRIPTLGESVTEATIGKWFKKPGEAVAVDEPLVELETDKVTIEVPSPAAGVLADIAAKDGDTVAVGALIGKINEGAGTAASGKPESKTVVANPTAHVNFEKRWSPYCSGPAPAPSNKSSKSCGPASME